MPDGLIRGQEPNNFALCLHRLLHGLLGFPYQPRLALWPTQNL